QKFLKNHRRRKPGSRNLQDRDHHYPQSHVEAEEGGGMRAAAVGDARVARVEAPRAAAQHHVWRTRGIWVVHPFPDIATAVPHSSLAPSLWIGGHCSGTGFMEGLGVTAKPFVPRIIVCKPPPLPAISTV